MKKPAYLGMPILGISKTLMYEFWYDYVKPKYQDKEKLCYMDTDSFINHIEIKDFYEDIVDDAEKWFDTSNQDEDVDKQLLKGMNKNVIGLFKDELGGKIMKELVAFRPKTWPYLMTDGSEHKKAIGTKECVIKRKTKFNDYKDCNFSNKTILKSTQRFESDYHDVYTEQINKIALCSNGDKRLQTFDKIATYPYGANAFKVCESEMLCKYK